MKKSKTILCMTAGIVGIFAFVCVAGAAGQKIPFRGSSGVKKAASISCRDKNQVQSESALPDYVYDGSDPEERLLCQADAQWTAQGTRQGFSVTAAKILGSCQQGGKLKLFARIADSEYSLSGNSLSLLSGCNMPVAVTFAKGADGVYQLEKFEVPQDGTFYAPSIRKFCTQPVSGEVIQGLAEKIIASDSCSEELTKLQYQHLANHLHKNGIRDAVLLDPYKKVEFSLRDYYK